MSITGVSIRFQAAAEKTVVFNSGKKLVKAVAELSNAVVGYEKGNESQVTQTLQGIATVPPQPLPASRLMMTAMLPKAKAKLSVAWDQLKALVKSGVAQFASPRLRDPQSGMGRYVTDEVTVRFEKPPSKKVLSAFTKQYGLSVIRQSIGSKETYLMKSAEHDWDKVLSQVTAIDGDSRVAFAAPNFLSEMRRA